MNIKRLFILSITVLLTGCSNLTTYTGGNQLAADLRTTYNPDGIERSKLASVQGHRDRSQLTVAVIEKIRNSSKKFVYNTSAGFKFKDRPDLFSFFLTEGEYTFFVSCHNPNGIEELQINAKVTSSENYLLSCQTIVRGSKRRSPEFKVNFTENSLNPRG